MWLGVEWWHLIFISGSIWVFAAGEFGYRLAYLSLYFYESRQLNWCGGHEEYSNEFFWAKGGGLQERWTRRPAK